jgi:hypothetical protein
MLEKNGQDRAMTDDVVSPSYDAAVSRSGHLERFHPDAAARDAIPRLAPGVALIAVLLLSLGLWGAIWLAVSALIAVWPW